MTETFEPIGQNQLLSLLPSVEAERLRAMMETLAFSAHDVLVHNHVPMTHVYFPLTAVISLVRTFEDGSTVEVATIGNEGMIGNNFLLGIDSIPVDAMVQISGEALTMPARHFLAEIVRDGRPRQIVACYTMALINQIAQSVACNARHTIAQRCARWLLMTHDRVERDDFPMTHELLALMLGVRRSGVTVAAGELQRAGLIDYHRGHIIITDRAGLESAACECYAVVRDESERIMRG